MKKELKYLLYFIFFAALLGECYLVLKAERASHNFATYKNYLILSKYRIFVRPLLVLSLSPLVFKRYDNNYRDIYLYIGLFCTFMADVLVLTQISALIYAGITLYPVSYLLLAESLNRLIKRVKYKISGLFVTLISAVVIVGGLMIYLPDMYDTTKFILLGLHIISLIYLINVSLKIKKKLKSLKTIRFILASIVCVALANIIYGVSMLIFDNAHPSLNVLTAFFYGLFLFFLINSITYLKERQHQKEDDFESSIALKQ